MPGGNVGIGVNVLVGIGEGGGVPPGGAVGLETAYSSANDILLKSVVSLKHSAPKLPAFINLTAVS